MPMCLFLLFFWLLAEFKQKWRLIQHAHFFQENWSEDCLCVTIGCEANCIHSVSNSLPSKPVLLPMLPYNGCRTSFCKDGNNNVLLSWLNYEENFKLLFYMLSQWQLTTNAKLSAFLSLACVAGGTGEEVRLGTCHHLICECTRVFEKWRVSNAMNCMEGNMCSTGSDKELCEIDWWCPHKVWFCEDKLCMFLTYDSRNQRHAIFVYKIQSGVPRFGCTLSSAMN